MMQKRKSNNNPLLVTGPHRSGTTWVGKILSAAPCTGYIHEPFNIANNRYYFTKEFVHWFLYINDRNEHQYYSSIKKTIGFKLSFPNLSELDIIQLGKYFLRLWQFQYYSLFHYRPIIKDPIAFFSASWLAKNMKCDVLVMMRHPASFIASLKKKQWYFNFIILRAQEDLMDQLSPFRDEIEQFSRGNDDIIEQGILLWRIFAYKTDQYKYQHPDWMVVKHEDLIAEPDAKFKKVFNHYGLDYSNKVDSFLNKTVSERNPQEVTKTVNIYRDTSSIGKLWKKRLSSDEIVKIRNGVADYYYHFYGDSDWQTPK